MRTRLLPLVLLAACGGSKKTETVPAPPPPAPEEAAKPTPPTPTPAPPASNDAALIEEAKKFVADTDKELRQLMVDSSQTERTNETDIAPEHEAAAAKSAEALANGITRLIKASRKFEPVMSKLDP